MLHFWRYTSFWKYATFWNYAIFWKYTTFINIPIFGSCFNLEVYYIYEYVNFREYAILFATVLHFLVIIARIFRRGAVAQFANSKCPQFNCKPDLICVQIKEGVHFDYCLCVSAMYQSYSLIQLKSDRPGGDGTLRSV